MRAVLRGVLAWIIGAAVAVGVGMLALSRIGYGFSMSTVEPLSSGPVTAPPVATLPSRPPLPSVSPEPEVPRPVPSPRPRRSSSPPMSRERSFSSRGGSVIVRCTHGAAYLVSWSPEQGYWVDDVRRGPASEVTVEFEDHDAELRLRVWCEDDIPQARIGVEHDND